MRTSEKKTKHLIIQAMSRDELSEKASGSDAAAAMYARHLARADEQSEGKIKSPGWEFSTHWKVLLKPAKGSPKGAQPELIGDLYFKGKPECGSVVIGYMIDEEHRKQGYGSEAVEAMVQWAEGHEEVFSVEADIESDNVASEKLLQKCGFEKAGVLKDSGRILYQHKKKPISYLAIYMLLGMSCGMSIGSASNNSSTGMSIGICIGVAIGAGLDSMTRKRMKELDEKRAEALKSKLQ